MALIARLPVLDAATAVARALEELLGDGVSLSTGAPEFGSPSPGALPDEPTRSVALPFTSDIVGEVTLVMQASFAGVMEGATTDADLALAALGALTAASTTIEAIVPVAANPDFAGEISTDTLLTSVDGDFAIVPILEGDTIVASLVTRVVEEAAAAMAPPPPVAIPAAPPMAAPVPAALAPVAPTAPAAAGTGGITLHEFQPLGEGQGFAGQPRSLTLLNEVSMEVTAELGRRRLKMRDIMSLQPGSVVELDKTAGSPVDVLVNGALVWHGEVVVVDEEFGIRVSEIVMDDT